MGWWELGEVVVPEYLQVGCLLVFVLVQRSAAAVVQVGGAAGGDAVALADTEGPDVALELAVENLTTAEIAVDEEIFVFAGQKVILVLRHC